MWFTIIYYLPYKGFSTCGYLALFPGSHTPQRKHWSCAGMESLVFFVTWKGLKVERVWKDLNCACAYPKTWNRGKKAKVASREQLSNLLYTSLVIGGGDITHTERWAVTWILHHGHKKIPGSPCIHMFAFRRRLEMRLVDTYQYLNRSMT